MSEGETTMQTNAQTNPGELSVRQKQEVTREVGTHEGPYFEPAVDIDETEEALVLRADLPGVSPEEISTDLRDNLLTLSAKVRPVDGKWKPLYAEFRSGNYLRQFRLGQQIDQAKITASYKDGVLTLTLPKADTARTRRIQVRAE
jgi:HSP20 family protein